MPILFNDPGRWYTGEKEGEMDNKKNYSWIYLFTIGIAILGIIFKDFKFVFFALIFLLFSGLVIQLYSGRVLTINYKLGSSKVEQPRLYRSIVISNILGLILAICGYIILF